MSHNLSVPSGGQSQVVTRSLDFGKQRHLLRFAPVPPPFDTLDDFSAATPAFLLEATATAGSEDGSVSAIQGRPDAYLRCSIRSLAVLDNQCSRKRRPRRTWPGRSGLAARSLESA